MASEFPNDPNGVPPQPGAALPPPPPAPDPFTPAPPPNPSALPPQAAGGGMIGRIQRLLMRPKEEWARIDPEPTTAMQVFMMWAVPLAAIGPICSFIGQQVFGIRVLFATFRPPIVTSLITSIIAYAMALAGTWVLALIIDALAPNFGSVKNANQAMKVAAYSYTAAWIAGVLSIIPMLGLIGALLGLYSFYLMWVGLPMLMKTPPDKAATYVIVSIVVAILVFVIIAFIAGAISSALMSAATIGTPGTGSVTLG